MAARGHQHVDIIHEDVVELKHDIINRSHKRADEIKDIMPCKLQYSVERCESPTDHVSVLLLH